MTLSAIQIVRVMNNTSGSLILRIIVVLSAASVMAAQVSPGQDELLTGPEFRSAYENPRDDPILPNVLLIGDSISVGYTVEVRRSLSGKADVFRIPTNGRDTSYGVAHLNEWLANPKIRWDVIHFNWGLWDICYRNKDAKTHGHRDKLHGSLTSSPEVYAKNLRRAVGLLKETGATLIWCNTTPVPENEAGRFQGDEIRYNLIAETIMHESGIVVHDLHNHCLQMGQEYFDGPGNVHFTSQGYLLLGKKVAAEVQKWLDDLNTTRD